MKNITHKSRNRLFFIVVLLFSFCVLFEHSRASIRGRSPTRTQTIKPIGKSFASVSLTKAANPVSKPTGSALLAKTRTVTSDTLWVNPSEIFSTGLTKVPNWNAFCRKAAMCLASEIYAVSSFCSGKFSFFVWHKNLFAHQCSLSKILVCRVLGRDLLQEIPRHSLDGEQVGAIFHYSEKIRESTKIFLRESYGMDVGILENREAVSILIERYGIAFEGNPEWIAENTQYLEYPSASKKSE